MIVFFSAPVSEVCHPDPTDKPTAPILLASNDTSSGGGGRSNGIFSPMEQMEELDVVYSGGSNGGNANGGHFVDELSLEKALGINLNSTASESAERELVAKWTLKNYT